jgi:TfoX/Sxy family transcriptional regulator of competence genes
MSPRKEISTSINADLLDAYDKLIENLPGIERKGATMPYTSINGHMFTFISAQGKIGIRLPEKEREEFLKKYKTTLFHTQGTILKEYITVPDNLLTNSRTLRKYVEISYAFVKSLKPKPGKKKK